MSSPFVIEKVRNSYRVTWPAFHDIHGNPACYNLLKILFQDIKVDTARVFLTSMDNLMNINSSVWYDKSAEQYCEWLMAQYSIVGVLFDDQVQAKRLQEELEKRYMWKVLKS